VRVAVTQGEAFDAPGFLRLSYATSLGELERGTTKIIDYLQAQEKRSKAIAG
jgi:aspartate/methionine/tyrosine aminotransferase